MHEPPGPSDSATQRDYAERMLAVLAHIQHNLDAALPLEELAKIAHFSPFHFHRVFRGMLGESVAQHVRRLRLERAAQRLKHTDQPVTAIAFEAGYESHEAFTRAFRRTFECTPSAFRTTRGTATRPADDARVHFVAADERLAFTPLSLRESPMQVELRTIEPIRVAFLRHRGPYDQVGATWEELMDWVGAECLFGPETRLFGACWDDPEVTPPELIRYDACVSIDATIAPSGRIGTQTLGGGRYAVTLHEGPYDRLGRTYDALLGRWFPSTRHAPADPPSLEFYLNDPDSTDPEDLLTEVCMPVHSLT